MKRIWRIVFPLVFLCLLLAAVFVYEKLVAPTRVALVNYPEYILAPLLDQEINPAIEVTALEWTEQSGEDLKNYDAVIFFGMGLHFTERQNEILSNLKVPVYVTSSTRQETAVGTFSDEQLACVKSYLEQGGKANFRRMLDYLRYEVDGKRIHATRPEPPQQMLRSAFFHVEEEAEFATFQEYMRYYREKGFYKPGRPVVCILSGNGGGALEDLILSLEKRNLNVVAAHGMGRFMELIEEAKPDMVIYQPHGRLSYNDPDAAVKMLSQWNIPLLCPIKATQEYEIYLKDQRGMTGGMLSQSVTMPELDGGIVPYTLSALYRNERGLLEFRMIPDRLERFSEMVSKMLTLKTKPNAEKKIAIVYYKAPGKNALEAGGLEVGQSILNTLHNLQAAGYTTGPLPETAEELNREIQENGAVFGSYAKGAEADFMKRARVAKISRTDYESWVKKAMPDDLYSEVTAKYGDFPGTSFVSSEGELMLPRVQFGNIVLLPQGLPGSGADDDKLIHGVKMAPPHTYIATYLWIRYGFEADAVMHFGTHGSLEFTPWKQVALSSYDWPDVLIGELPHYYLYVINNIGEAQIAKRRSYATMISHLTAPFMISGGYGTVAELREKLENYESAQEAGNALLKAEYEKSIIEIARREKYDVDLKLSESFGEGKMTDEDFDRLHRYIHEIENSKVNRGSYVIGRPYTDEEANETAALMMVDAAAAAAFKKDLEAGMVKEEQRDDPVWFDRHYIQPVRIHMDDVLAHPEKYTAVHNTVDTDADPIPATSVSMEDTDARNSDLANILETGTLPDGRPVPPAMMEALKSGTMQKNSEDGGGMHPSVQKQKSMTLEEEVLCTKANLLKSTEAELAAMLDAFNGGYLEASSGGDPVNNPAAVPTGKNLYGIDPERTPTRESYAVGMKLAQALIDEKLKNTGAYPKKVAFSLWGGEFIRTQGTNIGEIFYLLGVEPEWDSRGRVQDVRLIPMEKLQRPRIDVVIQTSGQFRGAATSRMKLIDKAVRLAAEDKADGEYENYVREGSLTVARGLVEAGLSPEEAKAYANARIFGGVNGNFGTGVTGLVQNSAGWDDSKIIADVYLNNMSAVYTDDHWGEVVPGMFQAALRNTDTVVQSRSSNSWGPLSLDHVYEFTGGMNLAVRNVTGKEPDTYFNDLRTPGRARIQEAGEAVMVEAHSTVLNPKYIQEMMEEGPGGANHFVEVFHNTFGWETMKPDLIKDHLWENYKKVYVDDSLNLGIRAYFEKKNPYALQEMTAVMLEAARKDMWKADPETIRQLVELHVELIEKYTPGCSGFVCNNPKLQKMIEEHLSDPVEKQAYQKALDEIHHVPASSDTSKSQEVKGQVLKEQKMIPEEKTSGRTRRTVWVFAAVLAAGILLVLAGAGRRRRSGSKS